VVDAFDAMTSDRVYRAALPVDVAFAELAKGRGSQFDPQIVDLFQEAYYSRSTTMDRHQGTETLPDPPERALLVLSK
jgi:HD-GYP domain-containing protein (c-di-GMP phosphodiesterase class II)